MQWSESRRESVKRQLDELIAQIEEYAPLDAPAKFIRDTVENLRAGVEDRDANCEAALNNFVGNGDNADALLSLDLMDAIEGNNEYCALLNDWKAAIEEPLEEI